MKLIDIAFKAFCDEYKIEEQMKAPMRVIFFSGALSMFVNMEKARSEKDMLRRLYLTREMKEFTNGEKKNS